MNTILQRRDVVNRKTGRFLIIFTKKTDKMVYYMFKMTVDARENINYTLIIKIFELLIFEKREGYGRIKKQNK